MEDFWNIAIPIAALIGSMILAGVLLTRARNNAKPEVAETTPEVPASASRRQRRVMEKLEPVPQLPTLMDLVREEIAELGIREIPGNDDISETVLLKVYRRDVPAIEKCEHEGSEFVVADGVPADEATEEDVKLVCPECGIGGTNPED